MNLTRRAITGLFRSVILPAYFRDIDVLGEPPPTDVRGRLFVSNHVNAILDPILVFTTCDATISPIAKSTLWKVPGMRSLLGVADAVKITRRVDDPTKQGGSNDQVFDEVASWLVGGGNILIFPEGTSHNEPHLVPLRSGAARMLERAAEMGNLDTLTVQSITLTFDDREQARSRVVLEYGPVFNASEIESKDAEHFRRAFNDRVREDLKTKLVEGRSWDEFHLISRSATLLANEEGDGRLRTWKRWALPVEQAIISMDKDQLSPLRGAVTAYFEDLQTLRLTDEDVASPKASSQGLGKAFFLAVALPFAAIGILTQSIPYLLTRHFAGRVKSGDETGTIRLGVALALHPPWTAVLIATALFTVPMPWSLVATALLVTTPIATIAWIDALPSIARAVRRTRHKDHLAALREKRSLALAHVREAIRT